MMYQAAGSPARGESGSAGMTPNTIGSRPARCSVPSPGPGPHPESHWSDIGQLRGCRGRWPDSAGPKVVPAATRPATAQLRCTVGCSRGWPRRCSWLRCWPAGCGRPGRAGPRNSHRRRPPTDSNTHSSPPLSRRGRCGRGVPMGAEPSQPRMTIRRLPSGVQLSLCSQNTRPSQLRPSDAEPNPNECYRFRRTVGGAAGFVLARFGDMVMAADSGAAGVGR